MKKIAAIVFALALALAPALAFAVVTIVPPTGYTSGWCSTAKFGEVIGFPYRSLMYCRWPAGIDLTGDGHPEWVELTLLFKAKNGAIDCEASRWAILDLSKRTRQAIQTARVC